MFGKVRSFFKKNKKEVVETKPELLEKFGLTVGKWYLHNWINSQGIESKGLFELVGFAGEVVKFMGFDFYGEWDNQLQYMPYIDGAFIEAEKGYVDKRFKAYDQLLQKRDAYSDLDPTKKFYEGLFYAGVRGRKTFFVIEDNKDFTYKIVTMDAHGKETFSTIELDYKSVNLSPEQANHFIKTKAVARGFRRKDLQFSSNVLTGLKHITVWSDGRWNSDVISSREAGELLGSTVL